MDKKRNRPSEKPTMNRSQYIRVIICEILP